MKLICTHCRTVYAVGTRWCTNQRTQCPPDTLSLLPSEGDTLDTIRLGRLWRILPTSALYHAYDGRKSVIVKVAHRGFQDHLKAETKLLHAIGAYPSLLALLPGGQANRPYRKYAVHGEMKYFAVYESVEAKFLDELLEEQHHLSLRNAAWMVIQLANVIAKLHVTYGKILLNVSPETILIRSDRQDIYRPILTDLSLALDAGTAIPAFFRNQHEPIYLSPEALSNRTAVYSTDVYGLGLVLYESLTGHKVFPVLHHTDQELQQAVIESTPTPISQLRPDITPQIHLIVMQALNKDPNARQGDVRAFAKQLRRVVGEVPAETPRFRVTRELIAVGIIVFIVLLVFFLFLLLMQPQ